MGLDRERMLVKISYIREQVASINELLHSRRKEEILGDPWLVRGLKYALQTAVEAMIDLAYHVAAKKFGHAPTDARDAMRVLMEGGLITGERWAVYSAMIGFRNRVVHGYQDVSPERVYEMACTNSAILKGSSVKSSLSWTEKRKVKGSVAAVIVGLTGGIATGKSTVARMFGELGAHVIDFDALARKAVEPGRPAWQEIVDNFGAGILNPDGTINRRELGRLVFDDPEKLAKLNRIVHPRVFAMDQQVTEEIRQRNPRAIIVKEIPLLLEAGAAGGVDKVVVVYASPQVQLQRLLARGLTEEEALKRIKAQAPIEQKARLADYVIANEGSLEETRRQVEEVYARLQELASAR